MTGRTSSGAMPLTIQDSAVLSQALQITFILRNGCRRFTSAATAHKPLIYRILVDHKCAGFPTHPAAFDFFNMEGVPTSDPVQPLF